MSESEEDVVDWDEESEEDPEEQPLVIAGKSFTELLEDQLRQEGEEEMLVNNSQPSLVSKPTRPFLRRGMGLTRWGVTFSSFSLRNFYNFYSKLYKTEVSLPSS